MRQGNTGSFFGRFLLGAALLQLLLLFISIITAFSSPAQYGLQSQWSSYLIALLLLGISVLGIYRARRQREARLDAYRIAVPLGWMLGMVMAILLYLPAFGQALAWATLGFPWLLVLLFSSPATLGTTSPVFALLSAGLYIVFAAVYVTCFLMVARRSGSVRQGLRGSVLAVAATFLGMSLTFSLIDIIAHFIFHTGSGIAGPSSVPGFSPLLNYIASYQSIVGLMALWLLIPVLLGLLIVLLCLLFVRHALVQHAYGQES